MLENHKYAKLKGLYYAKKAMGAEFPIRVDINEWGYITIANNKRINVKKGRLLFRLLNSQCSSPDTFLPSIIRVCGCLR